MRNVQVARVGLLRTGLKLATGEARLRITDLFSMDALMAQWDELRAAELDFWHAANNLRILEGKRPFSIPAGGAATPPVCDFCGKGVNQVQTMIAGTSAHICDNCSTICAEVIVQLALDAAMPDSGKQRPAESELWHAIDRPRVLKGETLSSVPAGDSAAPLLCGFCGKGADPVHSLMVCGSARICGHCATMCTELVEAERAQRR
jgi:hypothetical protein